MQRSKAVFSTLKVFSITGKYLLRSYRTKSDAIKLKKNWSVDILNHLNIKDQSINFPKELDFDEPYIFVGNHMSYLDIPLLLKAHPSLTFVSKNEVRYWPIIGRAAEKCETIFVKRSDKKNKLIARQSIASELLNKKKHIVVFPSGTTSEFQSNRWNKGVFEIAAANNIKIIPFKIRFHPSRLAAYIDDDQFFSHLYNLKKKSIDIKAHIEFGNPRMCQLNDINEIKTWCES